MIQAFPARIGRQSIDSTKILPSSVFTAIDIAAFVPFTPYLIPTNNCPLKTGSFEIRSASHSFLLMADFWLYLSHSPNLWILKSISSVVISARIFLSVKIVPREGLVSYHDSTSPGSCCSSTDHSAHPESKPFPDSTVSRYLTNTVPADTTVGGVPSIIVCGLGLSDTTYFSVVSCASVYSCASSIIRRS